MRFIKAILILSLFSFIASDKEIAKGGSFNHYAYQAHPKYVIKYSKPEKWLGFRTVIEFK